MKNMRKGKIVVSICIIVLFVVSSVSVGYTMFGVHKHPKQHDERIDINNIPIKGSLIEKNTSSNLKLQGKVEWDGLLSKTDISSRVKNKLIDYFKKYGDKYSVMAVYDFLYSRHGTFYEMDSILERLRMGEDLERVLDEYLSNYNRFDKTEFASEELRNMTSISNVNIEDIIIADILENKGICTADDIINLKAQGESWELIGEKYNLVNDSGKVGQAMVTDKEIKSGIDAGLTKDEVIRKSDVAQKMGLSSKEKKEFMGSKEKESKKIIKLYEKKYK